MDIGNVYITNDVNNLYIGFEYDRDCFNSPPVNLGIAFSYGAELDGGTTDPFARKIAWNAVSRTPDNIFYVVLDAFNYEVLYHWDGAVWQNISTTVNPGWGGGSDGLGMANDTGFEELALPLSVFGLNPGDPLHVEIWMTQDGTSKPPLDAVFSDGVQASTPAGTTFDVTTAVEMSGYFQFNIINAVDADPPFVTQAAHRVDSQVRVTFNEPVDPATAQNPANYALSGGATAASVVSATVDAQVPSIVHLTLSQDILAAADAYQVTVTGVQDPAQNTITGDGLSLIHI